ncbi:ABC transporter ATP-binding protein [Streptomyces sp. NPDC004752]
MTRQPLLEVRGLVVRYDGLRALDGVNFDVRRGEFLGLIGPNGAGKSTAFGAIAGTVRPTAGTIVFDGRPIQGLASHRIAQLGISRTFQHVQLFKSLSALENVTVAAATRHRSRRTARLRAQQLLDHVGLAHLAASPVAALSLGHQKLVAIARALANEPRLLMLDEMMSGLADHEWSQILRVLADLRGTGLALIVVEHIMEIIDRLTDRVIVFSDGRILAEGNSLDVQAQPAVRATYLGEPIA